MDTTYAPTPKITTVGPMISIRVMPTVEEINQRIKAEYDRLHRVLPTLPQWVTLALACDKVERELTSYSPRALRVSDWEANCLDAMRDNLTDGEMGPYAL